MQKTVGMERGDLPKPSRIKEAELSGAARLCAATGFHLASASSCTRPRSWTPSLGPLQGPAYGTLHTYVPDAWPF